MDFDQHCEIWIKQLTEQVRNDRILDINEIFGCQQYMLNFTGQAY
jgi:hypothetical protein